MEVKILRGGKKLDFEKKEKRFFVINPGEKKVAFLRGRLPVKEGELKKREDCRRDVSIGYRKR